MPIPLRLPAPEPATPGVLSPAATEHAWQVQDYAVQQAQWRHDDALFRHGEWAAFVLLWTPRDEHEGLVDRCPTCYIAHGEITDAYGQSPDARCPECYGTTFDGGYRALVIRPSLWDHTEDEEERKRRGSVITARAAIQSTADFYLRPRDWIIRADGTRWQARAVTSQHYHTGFGTPGQGTTRIGGNFGECDRVTEQSAAYLIRPDLPALLAVGVTHPVPTDWAGEEDIRGPLVIPFDPADFTPTDED